MPLKVILVHRIQLRKDSLSLRISQKNFPKLINKEKKTGGKKKKERILKNTNE